MQEWHLWLSLVGMLGLGSVCKVGIHLGVFAISAGLTGLLSPWISDLYSQLQLFLFLSLVGILLTRVHKKSGLGRFTK